MGLDSLMELRYKRKYFFYLYSSTDIVLKKVDSNLHHQQA